MTKPTNQPKLLLGDFSEVDAVALRELLTSPSGDKVLQALENMVPKMSNVTVGMEAYALASARADGFRLAIEAIKALAKFKGQQGPPASLETMNTDQD